MNNLVKCGIFLAVVAYAAPASAQLPTIYRGQVHVTADSVGHNDTDVFVGMGISVVGKAVLANQALVLTPILQSSTGYLELPQVVINGNKRDKAYRRSLAIHKKFREAMIGLEPYLVLKATKKTQEGIRYFLTIPYEPWMKHAWLTLREEIYGNAARDRLITIEPLALLYQPVDTVIIRDTIRTQVTVVTPPLVPEILKKEGAAYLDFPIGQSRVLPDYSNNPQELKRVNSSLDSLWNNKNITITAIYLTGFASPDGGTAFNQKLSKSRADAFRTYLMNRHGQVRGLYFTEGRGEDWSDLEALVSQSSMAEKEQVLAIIQSTQSDTAKKSALMKLDGGAPYKYMKVNFFPKLRKVEYRVLFTETYLPK
ncbi:MAG: DUF3868 domain-containing protein [Alistipes sp.]